MRSIYLIFAGLLLIGSGCVTARQLDDLQKEKQLIEDNNKDLLRNHEEISTENKELKASIRNQDDRLKALEADTTILGTSLRHMRNQYDKINELNDLLSSKGDQLLNSAADENRKLLQELDATYLKLQKKEDDLHILESDLNTKETKLEEMNAELETRSARLNELESLLAEKDAAAMALKDKVSKALLGFEDKGLTIVEKDGKVYVSLEAKLLFPSGSTSINDDGKGALIKLAKAIEGQAGLEIIVEGHTDTDKLKSNSSPKDNWELSVLRATSVVKIMMENSDLSDDILSASGRSEFHPVDVNDKAKNRRIEIILAPDLTELYNILE